VVVQVNFGYRYDIMLRSGFITRTSDVFWTTHIIFFHVMMFLSFTCSSASSRHILLVVIGVLSIKNACSFHAVFGGRGSLKFETFSSPSNCKQYSQLHESLDSSDTKTSIHAVSRREAMIVSLIAFSAAATQPQYANADVSDGNALPKGAQQFARTLKLKTDIKVRDLVYK
jgi:hypothetical protein